MTTTATDAMQESALRRIVLRAIPLILPIATVGLMAYFAVNTSAFLAPANLVSILTQNAHLFVVAAVFAAMMMAGYVDLSVGSSMALVGVVAGLTFNSLGFIPGLLAGLITGAVVGAFNGVLIGYLGLSPIIVTLGMLTALRGVTQTLSPDSLYGFGPEVRALGSGSVLGISYLTIVSAVVVAIALIVMTAMPVGRHIIAIGVNSRAAFLVGVPVKRTILGLYIAVGLAVGIAGIMLVSRLDSAPSGTLGVGFELSVLTAVLLGGVPFTGGRGSIWKVLLGVWLIAVLRNGLTLMNIGTQVAAIVTGLVLIVAAGLEAIRYFIGRRG